MRSTQIWFSVAHYLPTIRRPSESPSATKKP